LKLKRGIVVESQGCRCTYLEESRGMMEDVLVSKKGDHSAAKG